MNRELLQIKNISAGYSKANILNNISLTVAEGEIVTIIGANGAGKTSTLKTISGILKLRSGKINFDSQDISQMNAHRIVALGMAHVPEGRKIFSRLNVLENLKLGAYLIKDKEAVESSLEEVFKLFPILKERISQLGGTLSGGEQQMLAIGRALMSKPKLLLLDEPSMGIAPLLVEKIFIALQELNAQGKSILLVEQNAKLALKISNRGYVLETGSIIMEDKASELRDNKKIKEAYLGG
ncbi:MAG: ABC transporter ATP-binding protein [Proteobacteria bacterium]|nr:ABC transporter ATP-binding protein [Pseudomonadota bacterium]